MVDMVNGDEVLDLLNITGIMVQHVRNGNWFGWNASVRKSIVTNIIIELVIGVLVNVRFV